MPLPILSQEQRAAALEKAAKIRKDRAELKEQLKTGKMPLAKLLDRAEADEIVGKLKVSAVLQSMPGIGPTSALAPSHGPPAAWAYRRLQRGISSRRAHP